MTCPFPSCRGNKTCWKPYVVCSLSSSWASCSCPGISPDEALYLVVQMDEGRELKQTCISLYTCTHWMARSARLCGLSRGIFGFFQFLGEIKANFLMPFSSIHHGYAHLWKLKGLKSILCFYEQERGHWSCYKYTNEPSPFLLSMRGEFSCQWGMKHALDTTLLAGTWRNKLSFYSCCEAEDWTVTSWYFLPPLLPSVSHPSQAELIA